MGLKDPTDNFNPSPAHPSAEQVQEEIARAGGSLRAGVGKRLYERIDKLVKIITEYADHRPDCISAVMPTTEDEKKYCTCGLSNLETEAGL